MMRYLFWILLLVSIGLADTHYVDLSLSADGTGTALDPWQWSKACTSWAAGDVVNVRGTGANKTITTAAVKGTSGSHVTIQQWVGEAQAIFTNTASTSCLVIDDHYQEYDWIDDGTLHWTAGANVTAARDADKKILNASLSLTMDANRADGDSLGYHSGLGPFSMTARNGISFKIMSSAPLSAGDIELVLSEDADGAKTNDYIILTTPAMVANRWYLVQKAPDTGTMASMNAATSVALYANAAIASGTIIHLEDINWVYSLSYYYDFAGINFIASAGDAQSSLVEPHGSHYITWTNCDFTGRGRSNPASGDYYPYVNMQGSAILTNHYCPAEYLTFTNCDFSGGYEGINYSGLTNISVVSCTFDSIGSRAINLNLSGQSGIISGCTFSNNRARSARFYWPGAENAAWTAAAPAQYTEFYQDRNANNSFDAGEPIVQYDSTATYAYFWLIDNCENLIATDSYHFRDTAGNTKEWVTSGGGGSDIHASNISFQGNMWGFTIEKNIFVTGLNGYALETNNSITALNPCADILFQNNVYWSTVVPAMLLGNGTNIHVYNNTLLCSPASMASFQLEANLSDIDIRNNIVNDVTDSTTACTITGSHNLWAEDSADMISELQGDGDSLYAQDFSTGYFTNYATKDFTLAATSPALNTASATYAPATDIVGTVRPQGVADDIGAYEGVNSDPVLGSIGKQTIVLTAAISCTATVTDADGIGGTLHTFTLSNNPTWLTIGANNGVLAGTPPYPGLWRNVRVTVTDGGGATDYEDFLIEVTTGTYYGPVMRLN
jgi:hypothetical protein